MEHLEGLFRSIDEIESLIMLIMEQCAVVRHPLQLSCHLASDTFCSIENVRA
jgi:hypothetical protein